MKIIFDCKTCGKALEIDPAYEGHTVDCCHCNSNVMVPKLAPNQVDRFLGVGKWMAFGTGTILMLLVCLKIIFVAGDFLGVHFEHPEVQRSHIVNLGR